MSNDPITEQRVRKKLIRVLAAWHAQYKNDPSMKTAANLYKQHKNDGNSVSGPDPQSLKDEESEAARRKAKEDARKAKEEAKEEARKAKEESERLRKEGKKRKESAGGPKTRRKPFNFEEVSPCFPNVVAREGADFCF